MASIRARITASYTVALLGTMAAFEVEAGATTYLNPVGRQIQRLCLEQGVFLRPLGNVVYLLPPLGISEAQLQRVYGALHSALADLAQ